MKKSFIAAATRRFTRKKSDDATKNSEFSSAIVSATPDNFAASEKQSSPTANAVTSIVAATSELASSGSRSASVKFPKHFTREFCFHKPTSNKLSEMKIRAKPAEAWTNGDASSDRKIGPATTTQKGTHRNGDHTEVNKSSKSASKIADSSNSVKPTKQKSSMTMPNVNQSGGKNLTSLPLLTATSSISRTSLEHSKSENEVSRDDATTSNQLLAQQQEMTSWLGRGEPEIITADGTDSLLKNVGDGKSTSVCPLDKVLEFLQAVVNKEYKKALIFAKGVLEYEPENDIMKEYFAVLTEMTQEGTGSGGSSNADETETSSSESDNASSEDSSSSETSSSGETEEDSSEEESESSGESRSSTSAEDEKIDKEVEALLRKKIQLLMTRNNGEGTSGNEIPKVGETEGGTADEKLEENSSHLSVI